MENLRIRCAELCINAHLIIEYVERNINELPEDEYQHLCDRIVVMHEIIEELLEKFMKSNIPNE